MPPPLEPVCLSPAQIGDLLRVVKEVVSINHPSDRALMAGLTRMQDAKGADADFLGSLSSMDVIGLAHDAGRYPEKSLAECWEQQRIVARWMGVQGMVGWYQVRN